MLGSGEPAQKRRPPAHTLRLCGSLDRFYQEMVLGTPLPRPFRLTPVIPPGGTAPDPGGPAGAGDFGRNRRDEKGKGVKGERQRLLGGLWPP